MFVETTAAGHGQVCAQAAKGHGDCSDRRGKPPRFRALRPAAPRLGGTEEEGCRGRRTSGKGDGGGKVAATTSWAIARGSEIGIPAVGRLWAGVGDEPSERVSYVLVYDHASSLAATSTSSKYIFARPLPTNCRALWPYRRLSPPRSSKGSW